MCAIMNFNYPFMNPAKDDTEDSQQKITKKKINIDSLGSFNENGNWLLTEEEINWTNKHFAQL